MSFEPEMEEKSDCETADDGDYELACVCACVCVCSISLANKAMNVASSLAYAVSYITHYTVSILHQ